MEIITIFIFIFRFENDQNCKRARDTKKRLNRSIYRRRVDFKKEGKGKEKEKKLIRGNRVSVLQRANLE